MTAVDTSTPTDQRNETPAMTAPVAHPRTELDPQTTLWLRAYTETKAEIARLEQMAEQARRHVEEALGDTEEGVVDGHVVVRWTHVTSNRLDTKKLKEQHPDIAEAFTRPQVTRRFSIPDPDESAAAAS